MSQTASPKRDVGDSVKTGLFRLRARAIKAGQAGLEATATAAHTAEQKLAEVTEVAGKELNKAGKKAERKTRKSRKELAKSAAEARKEAKSRLKDMKAPGRKAKKAAIAAAKSAGQSKRKGKKEFKAAKKDFRAALIEAKAAAKGKHRRRRWPWVIGIGAVVAGGAFAALKSRPQQPVTTTPPRNTPKPGEKKANSHAVNSSPTPTTDTAVKAADQSPVKATEPANGVKPPAPRNGQQDKSANAKHNQK